MDEWTRWENIDALHTMESAFMALLAFPELSAQRRGNTGGALNRTREITIRNGDTLASIAKQHGAADADLCALNNLTEWPFVDSSTAVAAAGMAVRGQTLLVPGGQGGGLAPTVALSAQRQAEQVFYCDFQLEESPDGETEEIKITGADLALVTGVDAVKQSLRTRLKRTQGENIDYPLDGAPPFAGEVMDDLSLRLYRAKLIAAVSQDPRISRVENATLSFAENVIRVSLDVRAADGKQFAAQEDVER